MSDMLKTAGSFYLYYKIGSMYLISIIFIFVSIFAYRFAKNDVHTAETPVTLTDNKCDAKDCSAIGHYTVDGTAYDTPVYYGLKDGGSRNKVYYDPNNPKDAVLSKFPVFISYILSALAVCLLLSAIGLTIFANYASNNAKATVGGLFAASNAMEALSRH